LTGDQATLQAFPPSGENARQIFGSSGSANVPEGGGGGSLPRPNTCSFCPSADTAAAGLDEKTLSPIGDQANAQ
jgi:hypothetical protein